MNITLENQYLRVEISSIGAELQSIYHKGSKHEYLWDGNPDVWDRRSPMLFPNCGRVHNDIFNIGGIDYPGTPHGFARDLDHKVVCANKDIATFRVEATKKTLESYPYKFTLKTTYKLEKSKIVCQHKVINYSEDDMYFSFGFHTGIRCPFVPDTKNTDYYLDFEKKENCKKLGLNNQGLLLRGQETTYAPKSNVIDIEENVFSASLALEGMASQYVDIRCKTSDDYVRIGGTDSPYTVFWSTPADVAVICIEPWYGVPDHADTDHVFESKTGINKLASMEEFVCKQYIEIFTDKKADK